MGGAPICNGVLKHGKAPLYAPFPNVAKLFLFATKREDKQRFGFFERIIMFVYVTE